MAGWSERIAMLFANQRGKLERMLTRRTGNQDLAGDLVQEAFARLLALGAPPQERSVEDDTRLLFSIARNAAIDHGRVTRNRGRLLERAAPEQLAAPPPSPAAGLDARRALAAMDEALAALPARTREIFLLRRVDGLSHDQIARRLNVSVSTVEKHLVKAIRHCQARVWRHLDQ